MFSNRGAISILCVLFLVLAGFGFLALFDITSETAMAATKTGAITSSETWSGDIYIIGDVIIPSGVTITIQPGTTIQFNSTTHSITVQSGGKITAIGSQGQPIVFKIQSGYWDTIEVQDNGSAYFTWCEFQSSENGITLTNNVFDTHINDCSFNDTGTSYLDLSSSSMVNVVSTKFEGATFESYGNLSANLGKLNLQDNPSQVYIQYYVNVFTIDGNGNPVSGVDVSISDSSTFLSGGKTNSAGEFKNTRATAFIISNTTNSMDFSANDHTVDVQDKWASDFNRKVAGISDNSTTFNVSLVANNSISNNILDIDGKLHINVHFTFKYPPKIQTVLPTIKVFEDALKTQDFVFYDNDDFIAGYNNVTINITYSNGTQSIYGQNGKERWISWSNASSAGDLFLYRTIESPWSPSPPKDYNAVINEYINITIKDDDGLSVSTGDVTIEYHNVPDRPEITGLPTEVTVTEDVLKTIPITVSDNDNATMDVIVKSDSEFVTYNYNGINDQELRLVYPNDFGVDGAQQLVNITATDNTSPTVTYSFTILFSQTPDPPEIIGPIPDKVGNESAWTPEMVLKDYWSDPDPDDDATTMEWYVTGVNSNIFKVSGQNVTANTPLTFNLESNIDLGGARNPQTIYDKVTLWLKDKDNLLDSQDIQLIISSTNLQPSLHKVDLGFGKVSVEPEVGNTEQLYKFMIEYKDRDGLMGDAPEYVRVVIDGMPYNMLENDTEDDDYSDGKEYYYETNLEAGTHYHYFECSDSIISARHPVSEDISLPVVDDEIYIVEYLSKDANVMVRIAFTGTDEMATVDFVSMPLVIHEENKGDIEQYFKINTNGLKKIFWVEVTVYFGLDYSNYGSIWLRKSDMELAYAANGTWNPISSSIVQNNYFSLINNITTDQLNGNEKLLNDILLSNSPVFTVIGWLDADDDGFFNYIDAFPLDPAASMDTDSDGSPNKWNVGKSQKDSTSLPLLHVDKFPGDPAASVDDDDDGCPDKWNPGKNQNDSNSDPILTLDKFPANSGACLDTDIDNLPDGDKYNSKDWMDKDDDGDDMPDNWELEWIDYAIERNFSNRFNPKDPNDAILNWDDDGRDNLEEFMKHSNPYVYDGKEEKESEDSQAMSFIIIIIVPIVIFLIIVLGLFMYTKMRREHLLEHRVREKIFTHISKNPGAHYRGLMSDLNLKMGVLTHHLNMLEQQSFIKSFQDGMYRRFYPLNAKIETGLILSDVQEKILQTIKSKPGISQTGIASNLGLARKVVNYHIKILSDAGFVNVETLGRESKCYYLDGLNFDGTAKNKIPRAG